MRKRTCQEATASSVRASKRLNCAKEERRLSQSTAARFAIMQYWALQHICGRSICSLTGQPTSCGVNGRRTVWPHAPRGRHVERALELRDIAAEVRQTKVAHRGEARHGLRAASVACLRVEWGGERSKTCTRLSASPSRRCGTISKRAYGLKRGENPCVWSRLSIPRFLAPRCELTHRFWAHPH